MTERPILYSFRRCPYALRARMAIAASSTVCVLREVALSAKPPEMVAASPKATVPVLVTEQGDVIDESLGIMRWALGRNDPEHWLDHEDEAAPLIAANDGPFKFHLDRYKYHSRHGSDKEAHRIAALAILAELEARLGRSWELCGGSRSLADVAIMPFVRQFADTDRDWFDAQPLPFLQAWLARHRDSALFEAAWRLRLQPWRAGDPDILFPEAKPVSGI
ncbi:glutathione S-transferase [Sphingosinicella rhizophila]|uniref:Glutathione S-transferase n=1 Tax=Sphingosinicella rhizophila TaxID=3050082 RepID=A0ABU3QAQ3_9SPHN|nr:glutathione S-transferase [Sphingosinicella sp. GR2756]MDT9600483.1 glutathione S-transferase [Sphingosinicella sp. GR2756]